MERKQPQSNTFSSQSLSESTESPPDARIFAAIAGLNSDLANAQRELARKNAELDGAVREKNQILGMAAHDLRNPLGIIVGMVDLLVEELGESLSAENRELLASRGCLGRLHARPGRRYARLLED